MSDYTAENEYIESQLEAARVSRLIVELDRHEMRPLEHASGELADIKQLERLEYQLNSAMDVPWLGSEQQVRCEKTRTFPASLRLINDNDC